MRMTALSAGSSTSPVDDLERFTRCSLDRFQGRVSPAHGGGAASSSGGSGGGGAGLSRLGCFSRRPDIAPQSERRRDKTHVSCLEEEEEEEEEEEGWCVSDVCAATGLLQHVAPKEDFLEMPEVKINTGLSPASIYSDEGEAVAQEV